MSDTIHTNPSQTSAALFLPVQWLAYGHYIPSRPFLSALTRFSAVSVLGKMGCALCKVKAARYLFKMRLGLPMSVITAEAKLLCVVFSGYSAKVCSGVIGQWQVSELVSSDQVSGSVNRGQ